MLRSIFKLNRVICSKIFYDEKSITPNESILSNESFNLKDYIKLHESIIFNESKKSNCSRVCDANLEISFSIDGDIDNEILHDDFFNISNENPQISPSIEGQSPIDIKLTKHDFSDKILTPESIDELFRAITPDQETPIFNEMINHDDSNITNEFKEEKDKNQSTNSHTQDSNSQKKSNCSLENTNQNSQKQIINDKNVNFLKKKKKSPDKKKTEPKNPKSKRKYHRDNLIKKLYSIIMKYFIEFYNKIYTKDNLTKLKNNEQMFSKTVKKFMKTIKNAKLKELLSRDIDKRYKGCN